MLLQRVGKHAHCVVFENVGYNLFTLRGRRVYRDDASLVSNSGMASLFSVVALLTSVMVALLASMVSVLLASSLIASASISTSDSVTGLLLSLMLVFVCVSNGGGGGGQWLCI